MHPISEPRLVGAYADERQRRADVRNARRPSGAGRRPHAARVAVGQLLVRLGQRLSGASPGPA